MGSKQRRERERQELKQGILAAAREIAAQEGWQAVTIRKVADRIEYSPPMIYEHFENKDALLQELMRMGFHLLQPALQAARIATDDPAAQIRHMGMAYWNFAWDNPELYQVMHSLGGVPYCAPEPTPVQDQKPDEAEEVFEIVVAALQDYVHLSGAQIDDVESAAEITWATMHGLISLTMSGRIDGREHGAHLAQLALQLMLDAWSQPKGQ